MASFELSTNWENFFRYCKNVNCFPNWEFVVVKLYVLVPPGQPRNPRVSFLMVTSKLEAQWSALLSLLHTSSYTLDLGVILRFMLRLCLSCYLSPCRKPTFKSSSTPPPPTFPEVRFPDFFGSLFSPHCMQETFPNLKTSICLPWDWFHFYSGRSFVFVEGLCD